jgi:ketosteroid isomerase-like protein
LADWTADFDEFEMTGEEFIDAGDRVVVRIKQRAQGHGSGAPVEGEFWFVYTMADGKWTRLEMFDGKDQAMEAAGLTS